MGGVVLRYGVAGLGRRASHSSRRLRQAPDNHYPYDLAQKSEEQGYTAYFLRMTSQRWRGRNEVNRPIWQHWVTIYKPEIGKSSTSLLFITGGSNDDQLPKLDNMLASIATATNSVITELRDVPKQLLRFAGDPYGPREIIANTWRKFIDRVDATWPLRLPMTRRR
jgi:PhoPQ-activated pathogenicity-related protein